MTREEEIRAKHREYMGGEPPVRECEECVADTLVQADVPYLLDENARLRAELEAAKEMIEKACVWLKLYREDAIDDVLRELSAIIGPCAENGGNAHG